MCFVEKDSAVFLSEAESIEQWVLDRKDAGNSETEIHYNSTPCSFLRFVAATNIGSRTPARGLGPS